METHLSLIVDDSCRHETPILDHHSDQAVVDEEQVAWWLPALAFSSTDSSHLILYSAADISRR
jgi:hypothetical protein